MADLLLNLSEKYFFTPLGVYPDSWEESSLLRQTISMYLVTNVGALAMYFLAAGLDWFFVYDRSNLKDRRLYEGQSAQEIWYTVKGVPTISALTTVLFMLEVRGYSRLYDSVDERGWGYFFGSIVLFLFFSDFCIYWIHRWLHEVKFLYTYVHKPHHHWIATTPWASHAFHPVDGFLQGLPYHLFVFFFPLHKVLYLALFLGVNFWTVSIHDWKYRTPEWAEDYFNGAAHHTLHHTEFFVNYGQYFTLWDRVFGTHLNPLRRKDQLVVKVGPLKKWKPMAQVSADQNAIMKAVEKDCKGE